MRLTSLQIAKQNICLQIKFRHFCQGKHKILNDAPKGIKLPLEAEDWQFEAACFEN
jgi:hypothetical protein